MDRNLAGAGRVVGFRLTREEIRKLDDLAKQTFRGRSDVMRLLLSQADLHSTPDILLSPIRHEPDAVNQEPAHAG